MEPVQMHSNTLSAESSALYHRLKRRNIIIGVLWLVLPFVLLATILTVYAISSFVVAQSMPAETMELGAASTGLGAPSAASTAASIIRVVMGLLGIVAVILMMVGFPVSIIYFSKRVFVNGMVFDERSGKGGISIVPEEIEVWNWGAVGLPVIWGLSHRVWISLVCLIPFVSLVFMFVMGVHGNEWAWQAEKWESVEAFKRHQDKWKVWGIIFFALNVLIIFAQIVSAVS